MSKSTRLTPIWIPPKANHERKHLKIEIKQSYCHYIFITTLVYVILCDTIWNIGFWSIRALNHIFLSFCGCRLAACVNCYTFFWFFGCLAILPWYILLVFFGIFLDYMCRCKILRLLMWYFFTQYKRDLSCWTSSLYMLAN